jgi:hypothetical protein
MSHRSVGLIPERLRSATLYVSAEFGVAVHLCACGCGTEIVTPIGGDGWSVSCDGKSVTLDPSIGNAGLACRSHYRITRGTVDWMPGFGPAEPPARSTLRAFYEDLLFRITSWFRPPGPGPS